MGLGVSIREIQGLLSHVFKLSDNVSGSPVDYRLNMDLRLEKLPRAITASWYEWWHEPGNNQMEEEEGN